LLKSIHYVNIYLFLIKIKLYIKQKYWKLKISLIIVFYCKNNICIQVDRNYLPKFDEIPDEKGYVRRYISWSFSYKDI